MPLVSARPTCITDILLWNIRPLFSSYLDKFGSYRPQRLSAIIPKLAHIAQAESLANGLLQLQPEKRISAKEALAHSYFADLPRAVYSLNEGRVYENVFGVY